MALLHASMVRCYFVYIYPFSCHINLTYGFLQQGDIAQVRALIEADSVDVFSTDERGYTCAHWAACNDDLPILATLVGRFPELCALKSSRKMSLLHVAVINNSLSAISYLLGGDGDSICSNLLDIDATNEWGESALHLAAAAGRADIARLLVARGLNIKLTDIWARSAATVAAEHGERELFELVKSPSDSWEESTEAHSTTSISDPVSVDLRRTIHKELTKFNSSKKGMSRRTVEPVIKSIFKLTDGESSGTPSFKMETKRLRPVSQQIEYPGDFDALHNMLGQPDVFDPAGKDMFGLAAIHKLAAWNKPEMLELLCQHLAPADINARGGDLDYTCLHHCIEMNAERSLIFFLSKLRNIVDPSLLDKHGRTALDIAGPGIKQTFTELLQEPS